MIEWQRPRLGICSKTDYQDAIIRIESVQAGELCVESDYVCFFQVIEHPANVRQRFRIDVLIVGVSTLLCPVVIDIECIVQCLQPAIHHFLALVPEQVCRVQDRRIDDAISLHPDTIPGRDAALAQHSLQRHTATQHDELGVILDRKRPVAAPDVLGLGVVIRWVASNDVGVRHLVLWVA